MNEFFLFMSIQMTRKPPPPPSRLSSGDFVHAAAKAAVSSFPFTGAAASVAFDLAFAAPASKRFDRWLSDVSKIIGELVESADRMTPETLAKNDAFISTVYALTQTAMKTSSEAKLDLFRKAIRETGRGVVLSDLLLNTFLTILDTYTPEHV